MPFRKKFIVEAKPNLAVVNEVRCSCSCEDWAADTPFELAPTIIKEHLMNAHKVTLISAVSDRLNSTFRFVGQ